jgi:hypothetical protein
MNNNFIIKNFQTNGMAWPFELSKKYDDLENQYFEFQKNANQILGHQVTLKPNLLSTFFDKLAMDESIIENVKKIIGENIYIWSSAFFPKAPGEGKIVSYHQDNPYWQLTTDKVITAWIALTNSDKNSGALEIVPGSAKLGLIKKLDVDNARKSYLKGEKTTKSNDLLSYNQNLDDYIEKNKPIIIDLRPSQYSLHHVNAVHGSGINNSKNFRIGFAVRYISSDTKHEEEDHDSGIHVCGEKNSYFRNEKRPNDDFSEDAIKEYSIAMKAAGAFGNKSYVSSIDNEK